MFSLKIDEDIFPLTAVERALVRERDLEALAIVPVEFRLEIRPCR
jgi:hypothetical protein